MLKIVLVASPRTLVRSINNRDYQISRWMAKVEFLQLQRESKAIATASFGRSVDFSSPAVLPSMLKTPRTKLPYSVNVTSGCVIHFRAVKRIVPLRAD